MNTFSKAERLYKLSHIKLVYERGTPLQSYPFRFIWTENPETSEYPVNMMIVVRKKIFKRAVDRNRVKRLIREAYRKNKAILYELPELQKRPILLVIHYQQPDILSYKEVERGMIKSMERLRKKLLQGTGS